MKKKMLKLTAKQKAVIRGAVDHMYCNLQEDDNIGLGLLDDDKEDEMWQLVEAEIVRLVTK